MAANAPGKSGETRKDMSARAPHGHSANLGIGLAREPAQGQLQSEQSGNASAGQSTPAQFEQQRANDSDRDWGWLGLIGLLGLAGLRRRREPDLHRDTTSAKPGYNR
jgi:MYXO-CTERM domain-containing protein